MSLGHCNFFLPLIHVSYINRLLYLYFFVLFCSVYLDIPHTSFKAVTNVAHLNEFSFSVSEFKFKNISFPFLAAVCDCAFAFFGGSGTSRGNQCFVTGDQSARSHLPTFGAILIKANWAGRFIGLEKINLGLREKAQET